MDANADRTRARKSMGSMVGSRILQHHHAAGRLGTVLLGKVSPTERPVDRHAMLVLSCTACGFYWLRPLPTTRCPDPLRPRRNRRGTHPFPSIP